MNENRTVNLSDKRKLGFAEYGDLHGFPLFFFHGWPSSRLQASIFDSRAKKLGIHVISVDRPGYGLSDLKKNRQLLDWPDDVSELADQLKIGKFSILGNSGGGPYSAVCAYKIQNRIVKAGISVGLAPVYIKNILDELPLMGKIGWANYAQVPLLPYISSEILAIESKYFSWLTTYAYAAKVDRLVWKNLKGYDRLRNNKEAFRQGVMGAVEDLKIYSHEWGFDMTRISCSVDLWYGEKDKNVPLSMGEYYHSHIPNSHLIIYPNEGHTLVVNHLDEILTALKE